MISERPRCERISNLGVVRQTKEDMMLLQMVVSSKGIVFHEAGENTLSDHWSDTIFLTAAVQLQQVQKHQIESV